MTRRALASWMGLAVLVGGANSEANAQLYQNPQGFVPGPGEPPLAPGMAVPVIPKRPGIADPRTVGDPADPPAPHVTIRVRVAAMATVGHELQYRLFVQNASQSPAHHVRVRAPLPSNSTLVDSKPKHDPLTQGGEMVWQLGTLAGGESREISLVVKPTGAGDLQCCARVQFEHGECVRTRLTQPDVRVRITGPTQAHLNDTVTISLEVSNLGHRDARDVVLTNSLAAGLDFLNSKPSTGGTNPLTWNLGTIAPGKNQRVEFQALVAKTGSLVNNAEVTDDAGTKQTASLAMDVGEPKLNLTIVGPKKRIIGRPAAFQITVGNPGTRPATHVELVNEVPPDVTFVSASLGGQLQGGAVHWKLGTLAPGAKQTVALNVQAKKEGELVNRPMATADRDLTVRAESHTLFEGATGLSLEIDKNPDPLEVGKTATYSVRVLNQGTAAAKHLSLTVTMPEELKVMEIKGGGVQDAGKITFKMEILAPGGEAVFTINAQALRGADARLRSELRADDLTAGPIRFEENITLHGDNPPAARPPR